ncbi:hypothetical protein ACIQCG_34185 [Streptomyces noursei]|uniref:hypothetical protein n=1 Tax=Streptomyces noursei TaxID=1971 RepID=UPI00381D054C
MILMGTGSAAIMLTTSCCRHVVARARYATCGAPTRDGGARYLRPGKPQLDFVMINRLADAGDGLVVGTHHVECIAVLEPAAKGSWPADLPVRIMCGVGVTGDILTLK